MYTKQEKVVIWLSIFDSLTLKKQHTLIQMYDDVSLLWENFEKDEKAIKDVVKDEAYNKMLFAHDDNFINTYIQNCEKLGIQMVTYVSDTYPELLKECNLAPIILYCKGDINLLKSVCVAIVGTRRCSKYGKEITHRFAYDIAKSGITVVSGLADGVDTIAHTATLDAGGKTIAVLGNGLNTIYPATNEKLAQRILDDGGLIISEYQPAEKPTTYNFPARNRIVAGLSKGVLITEATEKSGTMYTKDYAVENNRDVFAVPGRLTDIYSSGCNKIIKNLQSSIVICPEDIISLYGKELVANEFNPNLQLSVDEQLVMNAIDTDEVHYDELLEKTGFDSRSLTTLLLRMEIKGLITKLPGNVYCK